MTKKSLFQKALRLAAAALPLTLATSAMAAEPQTIAYWSFNYGYTIASGVGTPNTTAITGNGSVNFDGVKLGANEQLGTGDYYLTPVRHTRSGQVAAQDDKGAYHEVNAINCDGAALHMTSPVPTPKEPSTQWTWGDKSEAWPDGGTYSYQNPYNYFEIEANTENYKNVQVEIKAAGHNSATQYYAVAYSTDHTTWTVVADDYLTGASYNRWTTNTVQLPGIDKQQKAYIRIFPAYNWKAGNNVNQDNQFDLDDVKLIGDLDANLAEITGITIDGTAVPAGESYDFEYKLPKTYTAATTTFKINAAFANISIYAEEESNSDDVDITNNGDGTYTLPTPKGNQAHLITINITPVTGAIVQKSRYKFRLFHVGEASLSKLYIDGEEVGATLRKTINTGDAFTATVSGNIYTTLPEVTAVAIDGTTPAITSSLANGVATYSIKTDDRTFTLNIEGVHTYTPGEKDEVVTLNYTTSGFTAPGTWSDGLYTLQCNSLDGWNGSQFKFNATDHTLSVPGGVVVKQFSFTRFSANYGNGEGITAFSSEGATCYVPTKHNYVRGENTTVTVVLENHQPGAPVAFTINTGGNQPYASFELVIEKTNPGTAPTLRNKTAVVNNNHAVVSLEFDREMQSTIATINGKTVKAAGGNTTLDFFVYDLDYNKTYALEIAAGAAKDLFGNGNTETISYNVEIGNKPVATKAVYDYVVSTADEFRAAVAGVNASNKTAAAARKTIFVRNGLYDFGTTEVRFDAFNVSIIGESRDGVTLTGVRNGISYPIINLRGDQGVRATGYYIQDLTLQNDFNFRSSDYNTGQAVAVYGGNKTIMKNVRMHGNQDTQVTGERSYFDKCEIHGTVDFICGGGDNFYDQCDLVLEDRGGNVIAAPNSSPDLKWGYVFSSCTIRPVEGATKVPDGSYHLGRPWQSYPRIAYLNTKMLVLPADNGWTSMGTLPTSFYEYGSVDKDGNVIDLSVRGNSPTSTNTYVPVLTDEQAEQYTIGNVLSGADGWLPTDYTVLTTAPVVAVNEKTLSWTADDQVRTYVIFKDGAYLANTTETSYTVAEDGIYTIRTANDMGGLSTESTQVTVGATGVSALKADAAAAGARYNVAGQLVNESYKGLVIVNGKKIVNK